MNRELDKWMANAEAGESITEMLAKFCALENGHGYDDVGWAWNEQNNQECINEWQAE